MLLTINIPKRAEEALRGIWGDGLSQAAFEGLAIESYRAAKLSAGELAELLDLGSSIEAVSWLAERGVPLNYSLDDLSNDRHVLADDFPEMKP